MCAWYLRRPEESVRSLGTGLTGHVGAGSHTWGLYEVYAPAFVRFLGSDLEVASAQQEVVGYWAKHMPLHTAKITMFPPKH